MANNNEKKLNGTVIVTYRCNARCSIHQQIWLITIEEISFQV